MLVLAQIKTEKGKNSIPPKRTTKSNTHSMKTKDPNPNPKIRGARSRKISSNQIKHQIILQKSGKHKHELESTDLNYSAYQVGLDLQREGSVADGGEAREGRRGANTYCID